MLTISRSYQEMSLKPFPGLKELHALRNVSIAINHFVHSSAEATTSPCAMCTGSCLKSLKTCCADHSVFVAIYAPDVFTTGVAPTRDLEKSLRDMGADIGFEIARLPDGELARHYRNGLPKHLKEDVPFSRIVDSAIHHVCEGVLKGLPKKCENGAFYRLRYFKEGLYMRPIEVHGDDSMNLHGKVIKIKGPAMIVEKRDVLYAVDLESLVGRETETGKGCVNLQTSLLQYATGGSF